MKNTKQVKGTKLEIPPPWPYPLLITWDEIKEIDSAVFEAYQLPKKK